PPRPPLLHALSLHDALPILRTTLHLVTAGDCLWMRPLLQPMLERVHASTPFGRNVAGMDTGALLAAGRAVLEERPRTTAALCKLDRKSTRLNSSHGSISYAV